MKEMTAYEFIKTTDGRDYTPQGFDRYDINQIAGEIEWRTRGENFDFDAVRRGAAYAEAYDLFIELTMSCNTGEARFWLRHWLDAAHCMQYTLKQADDYYMAAYDILKSL